MSVKMQAAALRQARHAASYSQLCNSLKVLRLSNRRQFSNTSTRHDILSSQAEDDKNSTPTLSTKERALEASRQARERLKKEQNQQRRTVKQGSLAADSVFASPTVPSTLEQETPSRDAVRSSPFSERNMENMAPVLNPKPNARARWQRKMVIRHVRRGGRLTKEMKIARTERKHQSQSHFFKTSVKKLMPLARQIAGKSIDEAILQMRFSKKKMAQDIRSHLMQARNEAVVQKGMGVNPLHNMTPTLPVGAVVLDPGITPPAENERPTKSLKAGEERYETDMYVAEAWVNRGPYGKKPEYRARGRVNLLRPPHAGITVLLKEEKTRTREKTEKEVKAIKKRIGKGMWTQLPDRPITKQSQHVLW